MWTWHTRTWIEDDAIHHTQNTDLGWYLVLFVVITLSCLAAWWMER